MKKILFGFALLSMIFINSNVNATEIAIINLEEVLKNSTAVNNLTKSLETKKNGMEKKIKVEEDKLKKEQSDLEGQLQALSDDARQKKMIEFQNKVMQFQKSVKDDETTLQNDYIAGITQITEEIQKILAEMKTDKSGKYNYDVVLPKASAIYSNSSIDVSAEVLSRLNKKLKEIKVKK